MTKHKQALAVLLEQVQADVRLAMLSMPSKKDASRGESWNYYSKLCLLEENLKKALNDTL